MIVIQGHRGSSHHYPENTLLAYRMAAREGAHGIEADVRRTRDGVYVMLHDPTLDRTTTATGPVANVTYREIAQVDAGGWKDSAFAGRAETRIPTLDDVLDEFRGSTLRIVLQLKLAEQDALDVAAHVAGRSMLEQCTFFAPMPVINAVKHRYPQATTQNDGMPGPDGYRERLENAVEHGHHAVSLRAGAITPEMVDEIHRAGLLVHASYLASDYHQNVARLVEMGVDQILGNDCAAMVAAATPPEPKA